MLKKVVIAGVLALFFGFQLVQGLNCYYCISSKEECTNVTEVTCNETIANQTNLLLSHYTTVPNVTNKNNFQCLWYNYTAIAGENSYLSEIRSCVYRDSNPCSGRQRIVSGNMVTCMSCNNNLCNKNSAGTFSQSFFALQLLVFCFLIKNFIWC